MNIESDSAREELTRNWRHENRSWSLLSLLCAAQALLSILKAFILSKWSLLFEGQLNIYIEPYSL